MLCVSFITLSALALLGPLLFKEVIDPDGQVLETVLADPRFGSLTSQLPTRPGHALADNGYAKRHPVVIVPGIISTGLEVWRGHPCASNMFRERLWGDQAMITKLLLNRQCWLDHISLNSTTGLDPDGIRLRAAQGLGAADAILQTYSLWSVLYEELAALGYDPQSLHMASYDWRLGYANLEVRDRYFTRLKNAIEILKATNDGERVVVVAHSMGTNVFLYFLNWVQGETPTSRKEGSRWIDENVASLVNVGGPVIGSAKALGAMLSGEARDTAELSPVLADIKERFLSRNQTMAMLRSFQSSASMLPMGGDVFWGDGTFAPDAIDGRLAAAAGDASARAENGTDSGAGESGAPVPVATGSLAMVTLRGDANRQLNVDRADDVEEYAVPLDSAECNGTAGDGAAAIDASASDGAATGDGVDVDAVVDTDASCAPALPPGVALGMSEVNRLLRRVAPKWSRQVEPHHDWDAAAPPADADSNGVPRKLWTNALAAPLPHAPSLKVYCMYGHGLDTERAYHYRWDDEAPDALVDAEGRVADPPPAGTAAGDEDTAAVWIDSSLDDDASAVSSGVQSGNGDGTVPLLSLGYMCTRGWRHEARNPANISIVTREHAHGVDPTGDDAVLSVDESLELATAADPDANLTGIADSSTKHIVYALSQLYRSGLMRGGLDVFRRLGGTTADHVDILLNTALLKDVLIVAAGRGDELRDDVQSNIGDIAARVKDPVFGDGGERAR